jgi:predicted small lipoprotein YifL
VAWRVRLSLAALHLLYGSTNRETAHLSSFDRTARVLAISALALALGLTLSACGRRGPLEAPPGYVNTPQGPAELDAQGRPIAPPGEKKRLPIDVLLD